jgi:hypothetical protein
MVAAMTGVSGRQGEFVFGRFHNLSFACGVSQPSLVVTINWVAGAKTARAAAISQGEANTGRAAIAMRAKKIVFMSQFSPRRRRL